LKDFGYGSESFSHMIAMPILPDVLDTHLKIIFCGTAASAISAREGAYYANPANSFWPTLFKVGLTPYQFQAHEFRKLLQYQMGLTDIAKNAKGNDSQLQPSDYDAESLSGKIEQYQPKILAFTSKKSASVYFNLPTNRVQYGRQVSMIGQSKIWVLPSPSGAARAYWDRSYWQMLADCAAQM